MSFSLDSALGLHEQALNLRARRMEVLASNLANADTPGYKARDIDFKAVLTDYQQRHGGGTTGTTGSNADPALLRTTNARHLGSGEGGNGDPLYRVPQAASLDGNTVDPQVEKAKYMENALQYQASLQFIDGTLKTLRSAINGQ